MEGIMTVEELRNSIWASRMAQKEAEIVSLLVDLNVSQQRVRELEEQLKQVSNNKELKAVEPVKQNG